jgi:hypothetical protein
LFDEADKVKRLAIRVGALKLPQQTIAAIHRGIERGLCWFLAAECLFQFIVDGVADQNERAEPKPFGILSS